VGDATISIDFDVNIILFHIAKENPEKIEIGYYMSCG
jgi:hypothetical protein